MSVRGGSPRLSKDLCFLGKGLFYQETCQVSLNP